MWTFVTAWSYVDMNPVIRTWILVIHSHHSNVYYLNNAIDSILSYCRGLAVEIRRQYPWTNPSWPSLIYRTWMGLITHPGTLRSKQKESKHRSFESHPKKIPFTPKQMSDRWANLRMHDLTALFQTRIEQSHLVAFQTCIEHYHYYFGGAEGSAF